ncbi:MAG: PIN domain-containing protein [Desulfobacterales bacterium]
MILVDTSVWVEVLRDKIGRKVKVFKERIDDEIIAFSRFTQLELLQGAKNEQEWQQLDSYLSTQFYFETTDDTWRDAARIYFELRKTGVTLNSPIDCCIAQLAIENQVLLLHRDKDFEKIAKIKRLAVERFKLA